jgi:hypothetical protein
MPSRARALVFAPMGLWSLLAAACGETPVDAELEAAKDLGRAA